MTTTPDSPNFRALCAELVNELHTYKVLHPEHGTDLIDSACRELATPPPEPPTDEELRELRRQHDWAVFDPLLFSIVRAALERWGR